MFFPDYRPFKSMQNKRGDLAGKKSRMPLQQHKSTNRRKISTREKRKRGKAEETRKAVNSERKEKKKESRRVEGKVGRVSEATSGQEPG